MSDNIEHVLEETRTFDPPATFQDVSKIKSIEEYQKLYDHSIAEPNSFWSSIASELHWFKKWDRVVNKDNPPFYKWFEGGTTNISYNCLDRHLTTFRQNKAAIIWEGEPGDSRTFTYQQLHREVCKAANAFVSQGLKKGDRVAIYMPMVPELAISMLACARIGAIHSIVFGGFSANAIVDRVNDAECMMVITADGGYRRGEPMPLKPTVDEAMPNCPSVEKVIVVNRCGNDVTMDSDRDVWWHDIVPDASSDFPAVEHDAEDPLYILYTSGSTGKPKGILHSTGGYMVGTYLTAKYVFDLKEEDTYWCTADIGWVTGHSYIVYGILANGATSVMYEGTPNTPDEGRFWSIVEKYKVNIFYTAPTAIRTFIKWGDEHPNKYDLSSLRLLGTVGEPINPEAWMWYHRVIGKEQCPIVDTWWQTETGGIMITTVPGAMYTKPGSAGMPFFGVNAAVVTEEGEEVPDGHSGTLVIKDPWPSMLRTLYNDDDRFKEVYWEKFEKQGWYLPGDGAFRDKNGYFMIIGRLDDVINVSGHRLGTMEIESALVSSELVAEAAVVGFPHEIKGQGIFAFVTLGAGVEENEEHIADLRNHVTKEIGAIAKPDQIRFTNALPKTRSGKIMRRLLRDIAAGKETTGDITTLEDKSILAKLRGEE